MVCETITDKCLDVLALRETWHSGSDDVCLRLAIPAGYAGVTGMGHVFMGSGGVRKNVV